MLGLLADRPRSGYELLKEFQGSLAHAWPASHSQIYPELARLARAGLILQTAAGPRGAKFYEITDVGLGELRRWLRETEPTRTSRNEALLRVLLMWVLEPLERIQLLEHEREIHQRTLDELAALARNLGSDADARSDGYRIALDYGIRMAQARVSWAQDALQRLAGPQL
jgi:DNA-binding PadR family transcriptional regulator